MSEDSKESPPVKLTLSRNLKAKTDPKASSTTKAEPAKAPPVMKLRRLSEMQETAAETSTASAEASIPQTPQKAPEAPQTAARPETARPAFDPSNPFGNKIQDTEIKTPAKKATIQPPSQPRPQSIQSNKSEKPILDPKSGAMVEEAIHSLNTAEEQNNSKHSILPSIIVILILLLVLSAAGYGLWKILQTSSDTEEPAAVSLPSAPTPTNSPQSNNPIEKAKATIATLPIADIDTLTGASTEATIDSDSEIASNNSESITSAQPPNTYAADKQASERDKQAASDYLSNIHIGGVRQGYRPMIIVDGERYNVGDVVQTETGLKFEGLREGRLAFRDQNGIVYLKSF
ncbi:hypothetical protein SH580_17870 [Coraliomargarita algicola]|uniref:Uncharacterized protein n=1 Tax=Coraliomargarita algicola TaxID=3092156 RepID=A0ABZ0RJP2_9BACT|nr:hypothetical protein [Coraliomargarita sp. J2-16]WPJ95293.1 hypothetical protein SH580_17870 [Coraliomargarita sp. J2-16]